MFAKLGPFFGFKINGRTTSSSNDELETTFKEGKYSGKDAIVKKAIGSGMSERQAERWLRKQMKNDTEIKSETQVKLKSNAVQDLAENSNSN